MFAALVALIDQPSRRNEYIAAAVVIGWALLDGQAIWGALYIMLIAFGRWRERPLALLGGSLIAVGAMWGRGFAPWTVLFPTPQPWVWADGQTTNSFGDPVGLALFGGMLVVLALCYLRRGQTPVAVLPLAVFALLAWQVRRNGVWLGFVAAPALAALLLDLDPRSRRWVSPAVALGAVALLGLGVMHGSTMIAGRSLAPSLLAKVPAWSGDVPSGIRTKFATSAFLPTTCCSMLRTIPKRCTARGSASRPIATPPLNWTASVQLPLCWIPRSTAPRSRRSPPIRAGDRPPPTRARRFCAYREHTMTTQTIRPLAKQRGLGVGLQIRLEHLWLALVPVMVALKVLLTPIAPYDFWWHLAYGREIVRSGTVPALDVFSYTRAGAPYFDQPWLAQVLMYGGYQWFGATGLQVIQAILVAGTYTLLIALLRSYRCRNAHRRIRRVAGGDLGL